MAKVKLLDPADTRRRLDRYELIGEIASGGMATVFLARLAGVGGFQRFVAIKRLHPHLAEEEEFVEMFLDEARLAAGIHHPHVVPILEVGTSDSGFYLVMEYIEGDTLARVVARALSGGADNAVPRPILLRIVLDSLAGLHAAHELTDSTGQLVELVHRDCSPQNILVGVDGCSRITDFGVARATARLSTTRADRLKGKLAYMSPEQAKGDVVVDRRADVFSMGIVLWEVLAGRRLFKAEHEAATLSRVLMDPIPRLSKFSPTMPQQLDEVCAKALSRDLNRRYQSAAELADALERAARSAAPHGESGIASPREVAAYVQSALGQDIAAQRESVRAWLSATSEPSVDSSKRPPYDRTVKLPLDREVAAAAAAAEAASTAARAAAAASRLDPGPESAPPNTLVGLAPAPLPGSDRAPPRDGPHGGPPALERSATLASPAEDLARVTTTGRTIAGVGPRANANPTTLLGTGPALPRPIVAAAEGTASNGVAIHELDGEEDEGETQLMSREDGIPPPRARSSDEPTPVSTSPHAVRSGPQPSRARYLAVLLGVAAVVGSFTLWHFGVLGPALPTGSAARTPDAAKGAKAGASAEGAAAEAPKSRAPADVAVVASAAPTTAQAAPGEPKGVDEAVPLQALTKVSAEPRPGPRPVAPRGARPRPAAPPEPPPKAAPAPPPAPPPDGDLANPYR